MICRLVAGGPIKIAYSVFTQWAHDNCEGSSSKGPAEAPVYKAHVGVCKAHVGVCKAHVRVCKTMYTKALKKTNLAWLWRPYLPRPLYGDL